MDKRYAEMTDEKILELIHDNDEEALDYLLMKYKDMVRGKVKALYISGGDYEDLIQEGMVGLYTAIRDFDVDKDASFATFANLCTMRRIYTAINQSNRKKHKPLNNYVPFGTEEYSEDGAVQNEMPLSDRTGRNRNPEELIISRENMQTIEQSMREILSPLEREVLSLYLKGRSYEKIAEELKRTPKAVDNAIQRIRKKLAGLLNRA